MKEQRITFETAKLAKEKGFKEYTFYRYVLGYNSIKEDKELKPWFKEDSMYLLRGVDNSQPHLCVAPTQSLLQKWLREKFHIYCRVATNSLTCHFPMNEIADVDGTQMKGPSPLVIYKTYEEALEIGLQEALKLIK